VKSLFGALSSRPPVRYAARAGSSLFDARPRPTELEAYGAVGTLFQIVHRTSASTAAVDWKLYRRAASGRPEDRRQVARHPALVVWTKPNQHFSRNLLVETVQQHIDLVGEGFMIVSRDPRSSMPLGLWPVRPDRMTPIPSPDNFLSGWEYLGPDGIRVPLGIDEVIQLKMPNPRDPYRGLGPVQTILNDLDAIDQSSRWNANFFRNSAIPAGVIKVQRSLGDQEFKRLVRRWEEQHRGVDRAHRVSLLEWGEWQNTSYSMRDMQFTELRTASREVVREAFGFPKAMTGAVEDVNRANAEAGEVMFARWLLVERLERFKSALNELFLPMFSNSAGYEFDYEDPTPPDRAADVAELSARTEAAERLIRTGFDPDDVMDMLELPRLKMTKKEVITVEPPGTPGQEQLPPGEEPADDEPGDDPGQR